MLAKNVRIVDLIELSMDNEPSIVAKAERLVMK